jgi:hypothetical protein
VRMDLTRNVVGNLVFLCAVSVTVAATFAQQAETACQGRLDGDQFPFLVPEYLVWEDSFSRVQGTRPTDAGLQLTASGGRSLQAIGSVALKRAAALRAAPAQPGAASPATTAADLVLEARDDLLRTLSTADAERLAEQIESNRRRTSYAFAKPGRRAAVPSARITCLISIEGKEHPELIPEAYYWEFHLRTLASISEQRRLGDSTYTADFMSALRRQHLPIPERDVIVVLTTARDTIPNVDAARAKYEDSKDAERAVATIVRTTRLKLLLSLPRESWIIVQRDAARRRAGIVYDFPTTY